MRVFIDEYDRDYHTVTRSFEKEFDTIKEAEQWCNENNWSGYSYFIDAGLTKAVNENQHEKG